MANLYEDIRQIANDYADFIAEGMPIDEDFLTDAILNTRINDQETLPLAASRAVGAMATLIAFCKQLEEKAGY